MTAELAEISPSSIISLEEINTPEKRLKALTNSFTASIVIIAEMHKNRDWESLTKEDGGHYENLAELVQDALKVGMSYSYRLVQSATQFYLPLESVTVDGTTISLTSGEAAALGKGGMAEVVSRVEDEIKSIEEDPFKQSSLVESIKDDVLKEKLEKKKNRSAVTDEISLGDYDLDEDFANLDLEDDLAEDDTYGEYDDGLSAFGDIDELGIDNLIADDDFDSAPTTRKNSDAKPINFEDSKPKSTSQSESRDATVLVEEILSGGKEFRTESEIETLPQELQPVVKAFLVLEEMQPIHIASLVNEENRGVIYPIQKAISNARMLKATIETSPWVISQL